MKYVESLALQVQVLDTGEIQARRIDGTPVTQQDREEAQRLADSSPGITAADVMRVWPGAKVVRQKGER